MPEGDLNLNTCAPRLIGGNPELMLAAVEGFEPGFGVGEAHAVSCPQELTAAETFAVVGNFQAQDISIPQRLDS